MMTLPPCAGSKPALKTLLLAAGLIGIASPAWSAEDQVVDPELALQVQWQQNMQSIEPPDEGCFHASYPELFWERVECTLATPLVHPMPPRDAVTGEVTGNGHDYVAQAKGLINTSTGSFATS